MKKILLLLSLTFVTGLQASSAGQQATIDKQLDKAFKPRLSEEISKRAVNRIGRFITTGPMQSNE